MPRVVSLFLPLWSTDRFRRKSGDAAPPPETPVILIGRDGRRRVVLVADAAARAAGLRIGMPASKAQALVPGLIVHDAEPDADAMALERLGLWALRRYAPIVAADAPDGLVIDTTGADHLHGGEAAMLSEMVERLGGSGLAARAAVADSWGAAHALARFGTRQTLVVPPGEIAQAILPLPIAALRLPAVTIDSLRRLGFETIADLAGTPRASLTLRFGPEPGRRLDQASMHSYYSCKTQPYQDHGYTIFVAEVASTFNEQLLCRELEKKFADDPRMLAYLVNHQIDDIKATLIRQTMFAEFEKIIHATSEKHDPLTIDVLRKGYRKLLEKYFGGAVEVSELDELECLRIPHFYSAFYVYKYSTGISAAIALSQLVLKGGDAERERYLGFLKSGCSKHPLELLKDAGVDMTTPAPIESALKTFSGLVDRLEELLKSL